MKVEVKNLLAVPLVTQSTRRKSTQEPWYIAESLLVQEET